MAVQDVQTQDLEKPQQMEPIKRGVCGTVKWFSVVSGYGFINRADDNSDIFVHSSAIIQQSPRQHFALDGDQEVQFDVAPGGGPNGKGPKAVAVTTLEGLPITGTRLIRRGGGGGGKQAATSDSKEQTGSESTDEKATSPRSGAPRRSRGRREKRRGQKKTAEIDSAGDNGEKEQPEKAEKPAEQEPEQKEKDAAAANSEQTADSVESVGEAKKD
ncbi:cold shock domain-containing protein [Aphelenchoides fujianensis]|nr:cold shock domain-containing protein [Aphelenchoides fujianensis]